jgi:hypothetical protein
VAPYELAMQQWREGERRIAAADPVRQVAMERVTEQLVAELRKRLGSTFTVAELVELYDRGTSWCMDVAFEIAPGAPWAWDARTTADAAFAATSARPRTSRRPARRAGLRRGAAGQVGEQAGGGLASGTVTSSSRPSVRTTRSPGPPRTTTAVAPRRPGTLRTPQPPTRQGSMSAGSPRRPRRAGRSSGGGRRARGRA